MVDSMMIGRNLANIDPQSNFTGPNTLAELKETNMSDYPVTAATEALRRASFVGRRLHLRPLSRTSTPRTMTRRHLRPNTPRLSNVATWPAYSANSRAMSSRRPQ
jgi:hypothetical protein